MVGGQLVEGANPLVAIELGQGARARRLRNASEDEPAAGAAAGVRVVEAARVAVDGDGEAGLLGDLAVQGVDDELAPSSRSAGVGPLGPLEPCWLVGFRRPPRTPEATTTPVQRSNPPHLAITPTAPRSPLWPRPETSPCASQYPLDPRRAAALGSVELGVRLDGLDLSTSALVMLVFEDHSQTGNEGWPPGR